MCIRWLVRRSVSFGAMESILGKLMFICIARNSVYVELQEQLWCLRQNEFGVAKATNIHFTYSPITKQTNQFCYTILCCFTFTFFNADLPTISCSHMRSHKNWRSLNRSLYNGVSTEGVSGWWTCVEVYPVGGVSISQSVLMFILRVSSSGYWW